MKETVVCEECRAEMREGTVRIEGAKKTALGFFCTKCDNFELDRESGLNAVKELEEKETLAIQQKVVKLSHDRLGTYFNKNIVRSLGLKAGTDIFVSVPDKKHMIISLGALK